MRTQLIKWTLGMMTSMQPAQVTPWADTFEASATTIVDVATEAPLFAGEAGTRKTIALLVSLGWFEGRFDPKAKGDCEKKDKDGKCISPPQSLCMFQIGRSNLASLGVTEGQLLSDFGLCARTAVRMVKISFGVCRGRDELELLGHYASGGNTCGGLKESRHRMQKAKWLLGAFPLKEDDNG